MNDTTTADYRRRVAFASAAAGLLITVAGCAAASSHPAAAGARHEVTKVAQVPVVSRARPGVPHRAAVITSSSAEPHFRTPRAAMIYLAGAYNRHDNPALHEVTTPTAFRALRLMRSEAIDLRLTHCRATGRGDYVCTFTHRYPHASGRGQSIVITAPARVPGWYMYNLLGCG